MWFVAKPFLISVLVAAVIAIVAAIGAFIGLPGILLAFAMAIGGILVFVGAVVSTYRIFKWVADDER